ncbi:MAG: thioredoxin protein [Myxococcales bacterium]|nr:thioredoxin protein [Myxococcales bacterium]
MRGALILLVLVAVTPAGAADDRLTTGASHDVVWTPPTTWPVRGPRYAVVTIDVYLLLGHAPSYAVAEVARRAVERSRDVRAVMHLTEVTRNTEAAAEALVEAAEQERFFALFDRIAQARLSFAAPVDVARLGRDAGLDGARLDDALASRRHRGEVERLVHEARGHRAVEILINGHRISPWAGEEAVNHALAEARTRAADLLADGVPLSQLYERLVDVDEEVPFTIDPGARGTRRRLAIDVDNAPVRGPSTAPVTVVLWANFACMQCADVAASLKRVAAAHPGLVRIAWKHYPSPYRQAIGQTAAEYAAAAHAQGRFWALHDVAMASRLLPARVSRVELDRMAASAGLDEVRLHLEVDHGLARAAVERDAAEARRLGVPGPGSVAVNGIAVAGAPSFELLDRLVAAELDAGVLERLHRATPPR